MFEWHKFVWAWEKELGDPRRRASEIPNQEALVMRQAYKTWRSSASDTPPAVWLKAHASEFERMGFFRRPEPGEIKVTSDWTIDVWPFDDAGQWVDVGHQFAAVRSFKFQKAWNMGMTHAESCMHNHPSREDALPCARALAALTQSPPTSQDFGNNVLVGRGVCIGGVAMPERNQGIVAFDRFGLVVPWEKGGELLLRWADVKSFSTGGDEGQRILRLYPREDMHYFLAILVSDFGAYGEDAWLEWITRQGLEPAASSSA